MLQSMLRSTIGDLSGDLKGPCTERAIGDEVQLLTSMYDYIG